jgi:hypothetical protein
MVDFEGAARGHRAGSFSGRAGTPSVGIPVGELPLIRGPLRCARRRILE